MGANVADSRPSPVLTSDFLLYSNSPKPGYVYVLEACGPSSARFYKECPHPDEKQRRQLGRELGLEPRQIKFWFQNKRTQTKAQTERADNTALQAENERIKCENTAIREALKSVICPACGGPPIGEEERKHSIQKLKQENTRLKQERDRVSKLLEKLMGKHVEGTSVNLTDTSLAGEGTGTPASDLDLLSGNIDVEHSELPCQMKQTAASAMDELIKLLQTDEPLWIKSSVDDQYFLHGESYNKINPRSSVSKCLHSRIESSKDSAVVLMGGSLLVDMFLDSDKWMDLFPTIVSKAQTIHVFQSGLLENQSGSLQLIYEQTQSLVPLIPPQEFYVIRYCQQIETDVWAVVDVSCDDLQDGSGVTPTCSWKRPSGCMIQAMPNGLSKVTWVEHIEVDDSIQINENCKGLVSSGLAFGAKRWVLNLQRICERYAYLNVASTPCHGLPEVRIMPEGRRSMAMLAYRMVKSFCSIYSTCGLEDLPRSLEMIGNGVQVAIRKNTNPGQPTGLVISAISCIWLPASPHEVFSYLNDHTMRSQWDILCNRSPIREIVHIPTGNHPANCISVLQPNNQAEDLLIFQETLLDSLGSLLVYAPIDVSTISSVSTGADSSAIQILASGFAISSDGSPDQTNVASTSSSSSMPGGSFLTAAFQVLAYSSLYADDVDMEFVSTVNDFVWSTVQKIKSAIEISGM